MFLRKTEVLVVGAGPVGLFAGAQLAARGVRVEIIDQEWRPAARSYALALHPRSLELLDETGLLGDLLDHGHRIDTVAFYDGLERRAELALGDLPGEFPYVLVVPQYALERVLAEGLKPSRTRLGWSHRLARLETAGGVVRSSIERLGKESVGYGVAGTEWVVERRFPLEASFVIGADGHRSAVRRALEIELEPMGPTEIFAVFELRAAEEVVDPGEVRVVFTEGTTNVLWPLGGGRYRWSFELAERERALSQREKARLAVQVGQRSFPQLSDEDLPRLIAERAPWFDTEIREVNWSVAVRFERRLASSFGRGNVWLAGDAAHLASPVGVQSLNLGLEEARELATDLAAILRQGASRELLDVYGEAQRAEWRRLLTGGNCPRVQDSADPWIRANACRVLPAIPASGEDLELLAAQVGIAVE